MDICTHWFLQQLESVRLFGVTLITLTEEYREAIIVLELHFCIILLIITIMMIIVVE